MAEPVRAKICGLRTFEAAREAVLGGADAIGFILAPSKRQITLDDVAVIRRRLRSEFDTIPPMIGVTVNLDRPDLEAIAASDAVDVIQLSGDEEPDLIAGFGFPAWKAIRVAPDESPESASARVDAWLTARTPAREILLDAYHPGLYGGTGITGDWATSARLAARFPIRLAGGLTPENVVEAIAAVRPAAVDVASGVETHGVKDAGKIRAFLDAARTALPVPY